jgi:hypothetical protein
MSTASLGIILLCHTALSRAAEVARFWADAGSPVVVHVDKRVSQQAFMAFRESLTDLPHVKFSARHQCEWGMWSLVGATQDAAEMLLQGFPDVQHVYLASGACLPLRPAQELQSWLAARPLTDFIESVHTGDATWTVGGLSGERFTLRFPFSWKKQRWLFDRLVQLQRKFKLHRDVPRPLVPHLGSQWWCLTRKTLDAILQDPKRARYDKFFQGVWIPDESYFQTLARKHSSQIESRSLTLSKFDFQGKPHIFYDDHLQLLRRSDCFMARKIWPDADKLYDFFLSDKPHQLGSAEPQPGKINRHFSRATEQRTQGRAGLYMQSRFPTGDWERGKTAGPYAMLSGFDQVFQGFEAWLTRATGSRVHGHLFHPERVEFAGRAKVFNGAISNSVAQRDYNQRQFLTNLVWATRGERQCFQSSPRDVQNSSLSWFMAKDENATIAVISGAWALPLFRQSYQPNDLRNHAALLQKREAAFLDILKTPYVRARVRVWTLAEFLENPFDALNTVLDDIAPQMPGRTQEAPTLQSLNGFGAFLQELRNQGMPPFLLGDYPVAHEFDTIDLPQGRRA